MTPTLWHHIDSMDVHKKYGLKYQVKVEQALARFINGSKIRSGIDIKELKPFGNGVWEIKIIEEPQTRIFGAFAEYDVFIAFWMKKRDDVAGKSFNPDFSNFLDSVKNQWALIFKDTEMLLSSNINDLITNGVCYDPRKR